MVEEIKIDTDYITLGQLLKLAGFIQTGGEAKWYLAENRVLVNGVEESRRGRKLRNGDRIQLNETRTFIITRS